MTAEVAVDTSAVRAFPDEELLAKFNALRWDEQRQGIVSTILFQWKVDQIAKLPVFAAEQLYAHLTRPEQGIRVQSIPMDQGFDKMTERNKRRFAKKHMRVIGIKDMMLDEFEKKTKTDQFLFLHARLPEKFMPLKIERWYE